MLWANLTNRITVRRRSAYVVEPAVAGVTLTVARQPPRASLLEVSVEGGTSNTGTVYATGLVAGVTTTEAVAFDGTVGRRQTTAMFTSAAGITTTGLADEAVPPTVGVRSIGRDGSPQASAATLVSDWPASIPDGPNRWDASVPARQQDGTTDRAVIAWSDTFTPREGDEIVDDLGRAWLVEGSPRRAGTTIAWLWRVRLRRHEVT